MRIPPVPRTTNRAVLAPARDLISVCAVVAPRRQMPSGCCTELMRGRLPAAIRPARRFFVDHAAVIFFNTSMQSAPPVSGGARGMPRRSLGVAARPDEREAVFVFSLD